MLVQYTYAFKPLIWNKQFFYRFATTVIVVDVTGTAVNQGPSFTAGTYNILVSEGIPTGSSVFASPVSHHLFFTNVIQCTVKLKLKVKLHSQYTCI